jgi:hypothetical protein
MKVTEGEDICYIQLVQNWEKWRALVKTEINFRLP